MSGDEEIQPIDWEKYEDEMCNYVQSEEWEGYDETGKLIYRGVYLCLNQRFSKPLTDLAPNLLWAEVKSALARNGIKYNPFVLTIDGGNNDGVNLGITVDIDDVDRIATLTNEFSIARAIQQSVEYKPELWKDKSQPFDFRSEKLFDGNPLLNRDNSIVQKHLASRSRSS